MEITVNGETREVPDTTSAEDLVQMLELGGQRVAMEINREIVPRSSYAGHLLRPGDRVEIVRAVGGG